MNAATMTTDYLAARMTGYTGRQQGRASPGEELHCTMDRYSVGLK